MQLATRFLNGSLSKTAPKSSRIKWTPESPFQDSAVQTDSGVETSEAGVLEGNGFEFSSAMLGREKHVVSRSYPTVSRNCCD